MTYVKDCVANMSLTKGEMNVVRNGLTLIMSLDQTGKIELSESARKLYTNVLDKFETIYDGKWQ